MNINTAKRALGIDMRGLKLMSFINLWARRLKICTLTSSPFPLLRWLLLISVGLDMLIVCKFMYNSGR